MKNRLYRNKYHYLDYTFVLILIIYGGSATTFTRSLNSWEVIQGLLLIFGFTLYYVEKNKIKISKKFLVLLACFTIYFIGLTIKFHELHPRFWGIYIVSFFITYVAITRLKHHFFFIYEEVMYYLCWIALFIWLLFQVFPTALTSLFDVIAFSAPGSANVKSNILIYTINDSKFIGEEYYINLGFFSFSRNPGFAWEPGAFAVFICLAVYIHMIKCEFKKIFNKRFWLYAICLFTTFSTTGFAILFVIIAFYLYNIDLNMKGFYIICLITIGFLVYSSDLMTNKLDKVVGQDTEKQISNSIKYKSVYTPQRYTSFLIDFKDFINNPVLGYGGHDEDRWTVKLGAHIGSVSGIGKLLAKFGLIGTIFFFVLLVDSSKKLARIFHYRGWGFLLAIIVMISISYSLIEHPLIMCFWMFSFLIPELPLKLKHKKNNILNS